MVSSLLVQSGGIRTFSMATSSLSNRIDLRTSKFNCNRALATKSAKLRKKEEMEAAEQLAVPHKINFDKAKSALDQSIKSGRLQH
jgi:hypothetical protein